MDGNTEIVTTKSDVRRMADNLKDIVLIQYSRDFQAPVLAGELMGTMTFYGMRLATRLLQALQNQQDMGPINSVGQTNRNKVVIGFKAENYEKACEEC